MTDPIVIGCRVVLFLLTFAVVTLCLWWPDGDWAQPNGDDQPLVKL